MFIERLVQVGRAFWSSGMQPDEVLRLISDVEKEPRFLENVAVIEVSLSGGLRAAVLPLQTWGTYSETVTATRRGKTKIIRTFQPDVRRGLGTPFVRVQTGNPRAPQGCYGVPVYILFPTMLDGLSSSRKVAATFWRGRLKRTLGLPAALSEKGLDLLVEVLQGQAGEVARRVAEGGSQGYGLVVLCLPEEEGPYRYQDNEPPSGDRRFTVIGDSVLSPGKVIVADLARVAERFRLSKTEEGAEKGRADRCSLCGQGDQGEEAVSVYSKAWPWLAPTWHPPFPEGFKKRNEVTNLAGTVGALCPDCYTALLLGAGVFSEVAGVLPAWLAREIFSPVASAGGREAARGSGGQVRIRGSVLVVPLRQGEEEGEALAEALEIYRRKKNPRAGRNDRALQAITGLEQSLLPEEFSTDLYRLLMVYYTQDNADIHLRAVIEDVLPSTVTRLLSVMEELASAAALLRDALPGGAPDWLRDQYNFLIYLLVRAYGGCYLWSVLQAILHRQPISWKRFVSGAAARLTGYAKLSFLGQETGAWSGLREEVFFYLLFRRFYELYGSEVLGEGGKELADWQTMLNKISAVPAAQLRFEDAEELGFAAGYLVGRFGRQYYAQTRKDFLRHRVMNFGSGLTPEDIWRRALSRFQEYALRLNFGLSEDFRKRAAVVECEYRRLRELVAKQRDEFIGAFWSGYMLAVPPQEEGQAATGDTAQVAFKEV